MRARRILQEHHSFVRPMGWGGQHKGAQGKPWWSKWQQQGQPKGPKPKKEAKTDKSAKKNEKVEDAFPAYESLQSSSSSSAAKESKEVQEIKKEMREFLAAKDIPVDPHIVELLHSDSNTMEEIKSEQRSLNLKKKIIGRIEKLKQKVAEKKEAWSIFLDAMEAHRKKEKEKRASDLLALEDALSEAQKELNKVVMKETDGGDNMAVEDAEKEALKRELERTHAIMRNLQQRVDSYVGAMEMTRPEGMANDLSPQLTRPPQTALVRTLPDEVAARAARAKLLTAAEKAVLEQTIPVPVRSRSTSRSPRREPSNSLDRLDR